MELRGQEGTSGRTLGLSLSSFLHPLLRLWGPLGPCNNFLMVAPVQRQEHDGPYEPSCTHHDLTSQPDVLGWRVGAGEEQGCVDLLFPGLSLSVFLS